MIKLFKRGIKKARKKVAVGLAAMVALVASATSAMASPPPGLDFGSGDFDFSLADVVATAWNFLGIFPVWVQLVLGIILASTLIGFILWIFSKLPKYRTRSQ